MPVHKGLLPREGLCADVLFKLIRATALNPVMLFPLLLLARFTKQGQDLSVLHPTALGRLRGLFLYTCARTVSSWVSEGVRNNWVRDNTYDWSKEIVLITGGAGGIGGVLVRLFEEQGITVVVLDVQPMSFKTSSKVHHYHCDLRSADKVNAVADTIRAEVGHPTVIINNAGVAPGKTLLDASPADIRLTFDVNTLAPFWVAKAFLPELIKRDHGIVVTVSSYAAWLTIPNMVDYGASKAAALALHEGLTAELKTRYNAPRVRTVVVHPGHVRTALFTGYDQNTGFLMPSLQPETIADAIFTKIMTCKSGAVVLPKAGHMLRSLRTMPDWHAVRVRANGEAFMKNFRGRQVIQTEQDGKEGGPGDSTVLVSSEDAKKS